MLALLLSALISVLVLICDVNNGLHKFQGQMFCNDCHNKSFVAGPQKIGSQLNIQVEEMP